MLAGRAQPASLGREPQQGLEHGDGDQLGVGQLGRDPHLRAPRRQRRIILQRVIDAHIQCSRESVQIGVHRSSKVDRVCNADRGRSRRVTRGPLESLI